jgi:excisionase family DNA binding protein
MTVKDLALYSGQGQTKLRERIKSGDLPAFKVGGTYYIRLSEFHNWMQQHRYTPDLDSVVNQVLEDFG